MDYIRTVAFHHESPWILSASDDQTVRIWNWQSRQMVTMLTGHSHYVMCAQFHPSEPLVISASLDQTIRVWDLTGLVMKGSSGILPAMSSSFSSSNIAASSYKPTTSNTIDLFSTPEAHVKFVIEGHDRGVNWVQFHPEKPLIISGSDDRTIKLWRYNDSRAWEIDTFRGHTNNISTCLFHPTRSMIISDSEDKSIRAWDYSHCVGDASTTTLSTSTNNTSSGLIICRREGERFWCLALHPSSNLISAGHDSGLMIFKMEHERPISVFDPKDECLLFIRANNQLLSYDPRTSKEEHLHFLSAPPFPPAFLSFNAMDRCLLLSKYSPYPSLPVLSINADKNTSSKQMVGSCAHYVSRNRILCLNCSGGAGSNTASTKKDERKISLYSSDFSEILSHTLSLSSSPSSSSFRPCRILPGPHYPLTFLVSSDKVVLFDYEQGQEVSEVLKVKGVKYSTISPSADSVAFFSTNSIAVHSLPSLKKRGVVDESINIKGCCWSPCGKALLYTTTHHLKYFLPSLSGSGGSGDVGIICSLPEPLYLVHCLSPTSLILLDRKQEVRRLEVDPSEWLFKLSLQEGNNEKIQELLCGSNFIGQSIISYLRDKGHSSVALDFVEDPLIRFDLFLDCQKFENAFEIACSLSSEDLLLSLAECSLKMGNTAISSRCFDVLSTLPSTSSSSSSSYKGRSMHLKLISGNLKKTTEMAEFDYGVTGDILTSSTTSLLSRLEQNGQYSLVRLMRESYCGADNVNDGGSSKVENFDSWPLKRVLSDYSYGANYGFGAEKGSQGNHSAATASLSPIPTTIPTIEDTSKAWGDDGDDVFADLEDVLVGEVDLFTLDEGRPLFPPLSNDNNGRSDSPRRSNALLLLKERYPGLICSKLEAEFLSTQLSTVEVVELLNSKVLIGGFNGIGNTDVVDDTNTAYATRTIIINTKKKIEEAMSFVSKGSFEEALTCFVQQIQSLIWLVGSSSEEEKDVFKMVQECRTYIEGLKVELKRRTVGPSSLTDEENLSLSLLFSCLPLRKEHSILALRGSLILSYKLKCFKLAESISRHLLSLPGCPSTIEGQAKKIVSFYQTLPLNHSDPIQLSFGIGSFITCDSNTLDLLSVGSDDGGDCGSNGINGFRCEYCHSRSLHQTVCPICKLVQLSALNN